MPFYRQIQELKHLGFKIIESTFAGWFKPTVELLKPLYEVLKSEIMKSDYLQGDETTVPVVDKEKQKTNKEYLWLVRAVEQRLSLFHYNKGSHSGKVIEELTKDFKGYFQCDGFEGRARIKRAPTSLSYRASVQQKRLLYRASFS